MEYKSDARAGGKNADGLIGIAPDGAGLQANLALHGGKDDMHRGLRSPKFPVQAAFSLMQTGVVIRHPVPFPWQAIIAWMRLP